MRKQKLDLKRFIVSSLRRASLRWPPRTAVKKAARVRRGIYICNICKEETRAKDIVIDHIEPVINVFVGFTNWDDYITSLFVSEDKLQACCRSCHKKKSIEENASRRKNVKKP
jgi:5-methylcytosine-specific restriction endonuclease McrA